MSGRRARKPAGFTGDGMRRGRVRSGLRVITPLLSVLACMQRGHAAEPPAVELQISAPATLPAGSHGSISLRVRFAAPNAEPVLLSPLSQGTALEVVRGRLSRSDASEHSPTQLRFELPVIAHDAGTAILHVELSSYVCSARCERVLVSADQVVRIARP